MMLVATLLVSCGVSSVFVDPTVTPEPPRSNSEVRRISPEDLKERLDNGEEILIVDSRANSVFETRHIAGAVSVPHFEIEERLDEFPHLGMVNMPNPFSEEKAHEIKGDQLG